MLRLRKPLPLGNRPHVNQRPGPSKLLEPSNPLRRNEEATQGIGSAVTKTCLPRNKTARCGMIPRINTLIRSNSRNFTKGSIVSRTCRLSNNSAS